MYYSFSRLKRFDCINMSIDDGVRFIVRFLFDVTCFDKGSDEIFHVYTCTTEPLVVHVQLYQVLWLEWKYAYCIFSQGKLADPFGGHSSIPYLHLKVVDEVAEIQNFASIALCLIVVRGPKKKYNINIYTLCCRVLSRFFATHNKYKYCYSLNCNQSTWGSGHNELTLKIV